jgi:hypothetical protein
MRDRCPLFCPFFIFIFIFILNMKTWRTGYTKRVVYSYNFLFSFGFLFFSCSFCLLFVVVDSFCLLLLVIGRTYYVTLSYILCHIIIHTMSHYHTSLSTSFGHRQNPSPPHRRAEQANIHRHIIIHTMCTTISHHHTYYVTSSGPLGCPQTHRARKQQQGPATAGRRECREECILLLLLQGASHEPFLPCQKGRGQAGAHRVAHTGYHQYRRRGRGCARGWRPCQAHPHKTQYRRTTSAT